ncbi:DUF6678 family protein [Phenylobacterium terrae]|uniref:DUF6678 family protein n=1 Tax=Phenylobacterium terrae TaxID=2665495 RepID=A0ABW4N6P7_9CAUL
MVRHTARDREQGRIARHTRAALMSNTKWRKLIRALDRADLQLGHCVIKFVGEPEPCPAFKPGESTLYPGGGWIDASLGPIRLRTIEWLMFPRRYEYRPLNDRTIPAKVVEQNVDEAVRVLGDLGCYPIELSDQGLLIRGYLSQT